MTAMAVIPWTEGMRATAAEMWKDGASISTIAQKLALTKSAVAGYMNRNRSYFPKTGKNGFNQAEQVAAKRRERNTPKQATTPRSARKLTQEALSEVHERLNMASEIVAEPKPFLDLQAEECVWFMQGMDEAATPSTPCCAAPVRLGSRYCEMHHRRVYTERINFN